MKEHGILFSAPMVERVVARAKYQTRRLAEPAWFRGDTLWVRENYRFDVAYDDRKPRDVPAAAAVFYEAGGKLGDGVPGKQRPSIFLPRWASRITLRVDKTWAEPLWTINHPDAVAEGIWADNVIIGSDAAGGVHREITDDRFFYPGCDDEGFLCAVDAYEDLWKKLNGAESWNANPQVWVTEFSILEVRA